MTMTRAQIEDVLLEKGVKPVCVNGISMQPTIMKGESYYVVKKDVYCVGDIILFRQGDFRIVHRIIRKHGNRYQTKGDNYYVSDQIINESQIVGMIVCDNRYKELIAYISILEALLCSRSKKLVPLVKRLKVKLLIWAKRRNVM